MYVEENQKSFEKVAAKVRDTLDTEIAAAGLDPFELHRVLANLYAKTGGYLLPRCQSFEWTLDDIIALAVKRWLPTYRKLFDALISSGANSAKNRFDAGSDVFAYAFQRREDPRNEDSRSSRAIVLQTQNDNFIVVMSGYRRIRDLHIRRFWSDIVDVMNGTCDDAPDELMDFAGRTDLSLKDLASLSRALANVSDDVDGNAFPERPSLRSFLNNSMQARGGQAAGPGLHFGDGRDAGYVLSAKGFGRHDDGFQVTDMLTSSCYSATCRAMRDLSYVAQCILSPDAYHDNGDAEAAKDDDD